MSDYIKEFKEILMEDCYALMYAGDVVDSEYGGEFQVISREYGENRRWVRNVDVVVRFPDGRLFQWTYDEPLTEIQEYEFPWDFGAEWDPVEVEEYTETITRYRKKD